MTFDVDLWPNDPAPPTALPSCWSCDVTIGLSQVISDGAVRAWDLRSAQKPARFTGRDATVVSGPSLSDITLRFGNIVTASEWSWAARATVQAGLKAAAAQETIGRVLERACRS